VLVADDNATAREILRESLRSWGADAAAVADGPAALGALREAATAGNPYRIALIDRRMPDMSGLAVAERVGQDAQLAETAIILLEQHDEGARSAEPGIRASLLKPVKDSDLLRAVLGAAGPPGEAGPATGQPHPPDRPLRILVAEDNPVNQTVAVRLLEKQGHEVMLAHNGKEAVSLAGNQPFDVILMDVQMPEMDGFQATALIRGRERGRGVHIPIIALTAHAMKGDRERCLDCGMDGYLSKPIRREELYREIQRLCTPAPLPEPRG
jgi:CheY-like chemotaxis protein